ncbi:PKD-like domain-containing protein, partial [Algoriphagus algorifonticola]|uniref:PKD-like domain-containing protein n=1 Tax=Algoriphagus algorifonticola TaxID=2593007 RepID=UPI001642DE20
MRRNLLTSLFLAILIFVGLDAYGQSIFTNPITGTNPNTSNPYTAGQTVNSGITVSGIGRGTGITGQNAIDEYMASGWDTGVLNLNNYFEWTISPNSCRLVNLTSFIYTATRGHNSINNFEFRSSLDGFTTPIGTPTWDGTTINLSGAAFQNISTPITFRLYAWGANNSSRTFSILDFTFNGTVTPNIAVTNMTATVCSGDSFSLTPANGTNGVVPAGTTYSWSAPSVTGGITGGAAGSGANSISGTLNNPTNSTQTATYTVTPTS